MRQLARNRASGMVCLLILAATRLFALDASKAITQYTMVVWNTERGLPQNNVTDVAQTADGYVWLATQEGLARFDGVRFTVFNADTTPALPAREISALLAARDGSLWIATHRGGVSRYRNGRMTYFSQRDGLPDAVIGSMVEDKDGSIWIGTASGTVGRLRGGRFTSYGSPRGLPNTPIKRLLWGDDGALWAGTSLGGVFYLKEGTFTRLTTANGLSDDRAPAIAKDREGAIWIATYSGLDRFSSGRIENVRSGKDVPFTSATSLLADRDRNLWIGTENGGLYRYSHGLFSHLGTENGLPDADISALSEDREGSLWVGLLNGGVAQFRPGAFTTISTEEGLQAKTAWTTLAARDGTIWIGTTKGIAMVRGGHVITLTKKDGLPSDLIWSLYEDRSGVIWIGTTAGLVRYEGGKLRVFTTADGLPNDAIRSITADRAGDLWLTTSGADSVVRFHGGVFTSYKTQLGFDGGVVGELAEDNDGALWMATTRNVIEKKKDGTYTRYAFRFPTMAIHNDRDGAHWFSTWGGGLRRIKDGRVTAVTTNDGLFDDVAYAIVDDGLGYFWMTCNHGVYRTSKQELNDFADGRIRKVHSLAFGVGDGIKNSDCNHTGPPSASLGTDGRIWIPTSDGVVFVDPRHIQLNTEAPFARIEEVLIDSKPAKSIDRRLAIPPGRHDLEMHYTALSFIAPGKVIFRYRLRGFDKQWVEAGNRRVAYYTNIPPGDYAFEVMGRNNDGLWSAVSTPLTVRVARAYYQTWWFYSLLALLVATVIIRGHTYRVRLLRAETLVRTNAQLVEARDIAENLARMNEKLRQESALILDSVADGILRVGLDGRLTFLNPAAARMFGCDIRDFDGRTVHQAIHPHRPNGDPCDSEDCPLLRALQTGEPGGHSNDILWRADGSSFAAEYSSTPTRSADGNLQGVVIAVRDISERRAVEQLKDEFVSTVHELRTPLTSIRGALGLLSSGMLANAPERAQRMMQIAVSNTDRLTRLINDILDIERIGSGVIELNRTAVNAHDLMSQAIDGVQAMADQAGVGLTLEPCMGELQVDADRILQTLTNLVSNAIKFSPSGESVSLGGGAGNDGWFTVHVIDRGRGIPDDKADLIFERFKQVDESDARDKGGSDLGLAICKSIVNAHGGRIWTEKNGTQGSVFLFTVPLSAPAPAILKIEKDDALPLAS